MRGELVMSRSGTPRNANPHSLGWHWLHWPGESTTQLGRNRCGFWLSRTQTRFGRDYWLLLPVWAIGAAPAVLPIVWLVSVRRCSHRHEEQCTRCGYDLRATPDRCPECGAAVVRRIAANPSGA